jgi:hypothetical protein
MLVMKELICPMCATFGKEHCAEKEVEFSHERDCDGRVDGLQLSFRKHVRRPFLTQLRDRVVTAEMIAADVDIVTDFERRDMIFRSALSAAFDSAAVVELTTLAKMIMAEPDVSIEKLIAYFNINRGSTIRDIVGFAQRFSVQIVCGVVNDDVEAKDVMLGDYVVNFMHFPEVGNVYFCVRKHDCIADVSKVRYSRNTLIYTMEPVNLLAFSEAIKPFKYRDFKVYVGGDFVFDEEYMDYAFERLDAVLIGEGAMSAVLTGIKELLCVDGVTDDYLHDVYELLYCVELYNVGFIRREHLLDVYERLLDCTISIIGDVFDTGDCAVEQLSDVEFYMNMQSENGFDIVGYFLKSGCNSVIERQKDLPRLYSNFKFLCFNALAACFRDNAVCVNLVNLIERFSNEADYEEFLFSLLALCMHESGISVLKGGRLHPWLTLLLPLINVDVVSSVLYMLRDCKDVSLCSIVNIDIHYRYLLLVRPECRLRVLVSYGFRPIIIRPDTYSSNASKVLYQFKYVYGRYVVNDYVKRVFIVYPELRNSTIRVFFDIISVFIYTHKIYSRERICYGGSGRFIPIIAI